MPLVELRVKGFRAFKDTGIIKIGDVTPIIGQNDAGKSGLLHALRIFFEPPKRGGLDISDIHGKDTNGIAEIEVAFDPNCLSTQEIQIDAKNKIHLTNDHIVDSAGFLRLRILISTKAIVGFEILVQDIDDEDLFPLSLKNHDELLKLLESKGLPAKKLERKRIRKNEPFFATMHNRWV